MKDIITYKNFIGSVHFSAEDFVFFGKIEGINDLVTFEGNNVEEINKAFRDAVEDYVQLCKENNKTPLKSYKGSFNVRISAELHRKAIQQSLKRGISLNQLVKEALEKEVTEIRQ
ncbi:MAG: type II toxin-antitoxin system HicB family antitoxin [Spirochaetota bacterium]